MSNLLEMRNAVFVTTTIMQRKIKDPTVTVYSKEWDFEADDFDEWHEEQLIFKATFEELKDPEKMKALDSLLREIKAVKFYERTDQWVLDALSDFMWEETDKNPDTDARFNTWVNRNFLDMNKAYDAVTKKS